MIGQQLPAPLCSLGSTLAPGYSASERLRFLQCESVLLHQVRVPRVRRAVCLTSINLIADSTLLQASHLLGKFSSVNSPNKFTIEFDEYECRIQNQRHNCAAEVQHLGAVGLRGSLFAMLSQLAASGTKSFPSVRTNDTYSA